MSQVKLSVSLSKSDIETLDKFARAAGLKSRSAAIQQALHMDEGQRQTLRQGAQDYYDAYLSPKACIQNLLAHHPRQVSLRLLPFLKEGGGYA